jgi:hypothetical protein
MYFIASSLGGWSPIRRTRRDEIDNSVRYRPAAGHSSRSRAIGHAPPDVFEITVEVIPGAGS